VQGAAQPRDIRDRQLSLLEERTAPQHVEIDVSKVRVENCREFGGPWLAWLLIQKLGQSSLSVFHSNSSEQVTLAWTRAARVSTGEMQLAAWRDAVYAELMRSNSPPKIHRFTACQRCRDSETMKHVGSFFFLPRCECTRDITKSIRYVSRMWSS